VCKWELTVATLSDVAYIPITEPFHQLSNMCEIYWAVGQGQKKKNFYIFSMHCIAMQKKQALAPTKKRALLLIQIRYES
jgi:hypothetical protein